MLRANGLAAVGEIPPELARALCGRRVNSLATFVSRTWQASSCLQRDRLREDSHGY